MTKIIRLILLSAPCFFGACEQPAREAIEVPRPGTETNDDLLLEVAQETGLPIIDLSVAFEKFSEAPAQLQNLADSLDNGLPGLYLMRYHDDTLRHTYHLFAIGPTVRTYIKLTSLPTEQPVRQEFEIGATQYDGQTNTLTLNTSTGDIRLTLTDITPAGA